MFEGDKAANTDVWARPMEDGRFAIALFNRSDAPLDIRVTLSDLASASSWSIRDLWRKEDAGSHQKQYTAKQVPSHGVQFIRATPLAP